MMFSTLHLPVSNKIVYFINKLVILLNQIKCLFHNYFNIYIINNIISQLLGNVGGGVLSEAAALLNGAHIGMNSRLGGLLKRQQQIAAATSNDTNRGHKVDCHVVTIATVTKLV